MAQPLPAPPLPAPLIVLKFAAYLIEGRDAVELRGTLLITKESAKLVRLHWVITLYRFSPSFVYGVNRVTRLNRDMRRIFIPPCASLIPYLLIHPGCWRYNYPTLRLCITISCSAEVRVTDWWRGSAYLHLRPSQDCNSYVEDEKSPSRHRRKHGGGRWAMCRKGSQIRNSAYLEQMPDGNV